MRHHSRTDYADGDVERLREGNNGRLWHETAEDFTHPWLGYGHLTMKHKKITTKRAITNASRQRKPRCISIRTIKTSTPVMITPRTSGMLNGKLRAICLGKIMPGDDAEARRQCLQDDRHQVGEQSDRYQLAAELGAASEVGRPIARVHVADANHIAGAQKGKKTAQPQASSRHRDAGSHRTQDWSCLPAGLELPRSRAGR